jgi:hypothetical protein
MVSVGYSVSDLGFAVGQLALLKDLQERQGPAPRGGKQGATVMTFFRDPDTHNLFTEDEMQAGFENDLLGLTR